MADTQLMDLPDGRELAWLELGDPSGPVVLAFHGTPGSRRQLVVDEKAIEAAGVRLIAPDRPGYGHSTFHRGRRLADWATDVTRLADHLSIDRFAVIGVSGGGPHAAVCARFVPDRIVTAGIVSGVGPLTALGADEAMMGVNRILTHLALRSQYLLYPPFALMTSIGRRWPDKVLDASRRQLPKPDLEILGRAPVRAAFLHEFRMASSTSAQAAAQDFALFASDWGFRLEDIDTPVHIWHGDADRNVPFSHGRLQAEAIPGARFHPCPGEGHLLVVDRMEEILRTVTAAA
jgi:pimeloyl-ACP methyl ester carboxylesterase